MKIFSEGPPLLMIVRTWYRAAVAVFSFLLGSLTPIAFNPISTPLAQATDTQLRYDFRTAGTLQEASSIPESSSPYFWLNSGGMLPISGGLGMTVQGDLPLAQRWRIAYLASNPIDTDGGAHPQNIFRLVTKGQWQNIQQQAYFKITKDNLSSSSNRAEHNGLLLFNRYREDGQTLYYTGLRVDGNAVIKKKLNGVYTTLAIEKVVSGTYNRVSRPNLLPHNTWVGIRSTVRTLADGSVQINVYTDIGRTGNWKAVLSARDDGTSGAPILTTGHGGIRTDFMDVQFDDYSVTPL